MLCFIKICLKIPLYYIIIKKIKKIKYFVKFLRRRKKKMVGSLLLKKVGVESQSREKPKSGVLEKNINF